MVANLHHQTKLIIPICHFIPLAQAAPQFLMVLWNVPPPPLYSNNSTCVEVIQVIHVTNAHFRFSEVSDHFG